MFESLEDRSPSSSVPTKRKRYTPRACTECKRRKVKCDGQSPCHRCQYASANCVYVQRFNNEGLHREIDLSSMNDKISLLQEQIALLISRTAVDSPAPQRPAKEASDSTPLPGQSSVLQISDRAKPPARPSVGRKPRMVRHPQYMGSTSSIFTLGIAKKSLQRMGIQTEVDLTEDDPGSTSTTPPRSPKQFSEAIHDQNPLLAISRLEAFQLIESYEEDSGIIYPFLDTGVLKKAADNFYNYINTSQDPTAVKVTTDNNTLSGGVIDVLKLAIAIALVIKHHGPTLSSARLLDSVESGFEGRLCGNSVDVLEIQAWTLMSVLQFHCNQEVLAWRTIGLAGRAAVEMGLHRREIYFAKFENPEDRLWANKLFWSIYVLDRRCSFGTGLPFAINDLDIDSELPEPNDEASQILTSLIAYGRIASRVWKATSKPGNIDKKEKVEYLHFQVRQWQTSLAPELQLDPTFANFLGNESRTKNRLRVLLYLHANQMRLMLYRSSLLSPQTIEENPSGSNRVVEVAKDSIRVLNNLHRLSDIYSTQQTSFNYFLVSALAAIFLAVCHAPAKFNEACREEFFLALNLVRGFSAKSHAARKLWKTIKHLKIIGPKLGLFPDQELQGVRCAGTASGPVSSHRPFAFSRSISNAQEDLTIDRWSDMTYGLDMSPTMSNSLDGNQLSYELTSMFEAMNPTYVVPHLQTLSTHKGFELYDYGTTENLSRSLLDLF